ncbi:CDP-diacylglycerol--glycerol-3-phosphate 3-phosphatidyltransferase [Thomasclavelia spiroformis]|uniref:CDP-diacylglycerol--glycerol-3-phosphate 3-phosphatidyltransferase n=2 Tax=Thomasclavelia spiroformis TaxID=29348 RepID=A0A1Y4QM74_9FIRM|nr:CDP-diacylglycerol--glycerol-3-phosphate 3-phosphatidyltransferase [Thomasclavelia spiroformis]OUQ06388.1 CDP-diacylglycerol--glycerol-3-phosphate 3-phosphatidyltransferase [Thomasclavelia spiroformis]
MNIMKNKKVLFNIPNCLCFFRILLIPLFLYVYFVADFKNRYLVAAFVLVISGISDFLDGFIARKFNMVTDFGKFIDPVADKLTQFVVAITLLFSYPLAWILLIIIILKDLMLAIVGLYLYDYGLKITGASWWGKIATAYFYVIVIVLIGLHIPNTVISFVLIITGSVLMLLSFILYAKELRYMVKEKDKLLNEQKNG